VLAPEATLTTMLDRRVVAPWGLAGGHDGLPYRITLNPGPDGRDFGGKATTVLRQGDLVLVETCGGGGWGPPAGRAAEARRRDQEEGYV
jgi:N-methylhydantoinase B